MMKATPAVARAPRGTKPVSLAFFTALETIPEATRSAVAKSALAMIRDELKARREKMRVVAAKEKEKAKAAPSEKRPAKAGVKTAVKTGAKIGAKAGKPVMKAAAKPAAKKMSTSKANGSDPVEAAAAPKRRSRKAGETTSAG